ncbi:MAG: diadenylate cyclase CdaA [Bacteroidales bacterium]
MESIHHWIQNFSLIQGIDIFIVLFIAYQFYKLVKGTTALNITLSIIGIYIFWKISQQLSMPLTSEILDRVISMGFLALVVVFQPEIRRFLFMLSTPTAIKSKRQHHLLKRLLSKSNHKQMLDITPIIQACMHMSQNKTGALIVLVQLNRLPGVVSTGESMQSAISCALIENIFFKNSPLHDGALIIENNKISAARCILPVTSNKEISTDLGLRHRSAIGVTEQSDALAIVVSEETGSISYSIFGSITYDVSPAQLRAQIEEFFTEEV